MQKNIVEHGKRSSSKATPPLTQRFKMQKLIYAILSLFLLSISLVGCKPAMSNKVVVQNSHFTVAADSVTEGDWVARVLSPTHIVSNYAATDTALLSDDGIVCFRLAFNGHDNELPLHTFHYAPIGVDTTIVACKAGPRPSTKGKTNVSDWHLKVDLRNVMAELETKGEFATPTGDTIYREEFKGVWVAGNLPPLSWNFFNLESNAQLQLQETDTAGIYELHIPFQLRPEPIHHIGEWKIDHVNTHYPTIATPMPIVDALYNMSIDDIAKGIEQHQGVAQFPKRANHTRMSYPILLSLAYLNPEASMQTLKSAVENGVISHRHKRSVWPINTDDISWAMAAWEVYAVTGDKQWLRWAYDVVKRTIAEEYEINGDIHTGLIHGGNQFAFAQGQIYPTWMNYKDIYETSSLSNNVLYERAFEILNDMSDELGIDSFYGEMAQGLKDAINQALWNESQHHYFQGTYLYAAPLQSPIIDNFAQALAVLWNIATDDRAENLMMYTPVTHYGVPAISPYYQTDDRVNLSEIVTPMVQAFWNMAAAKTENEAMLRLGLGAMYRAQALFCANKGAFYGTTGMPLGNHQADMASAAGNVAMVFRIYAGMTFLPNGIEFNPFVPVFLDGKKEIKGFKYRDAVLNITIEGTGNKIEKFIIDGKETHDNFINAKLTGTHAITIKMSRSIKAAQQVTMMDRNFTVPQMPIVQWNKSSCQLLNFDKNRHYRVMINGKYRYSIPDSTFRIRQEKSNFAAVGVIAIGNQSQSYLSQPQYVMKECIEIPFNTVAKGGTSLRKAEKGKSVVEVSSIKNQQLELEVTVPEGGDYFIDIRYANGYNSPFCPTLTIKANTHQQGTIVLPCRGHNEWLNTGWSNIIKAELLKGKNTITVERTASHTTLTPVLLQTIRITKK